MRDRICSLILRKREIGSAIKFEPYHTTTPPITAQSSDQRACGKATSSVPPTAIGIDSKAGVFCQQGSRAPRQEATAHATAGAKDPECLPPALIQPAMGSGVPGTQGWKARSTAGAFDPAQRRRKHENHRFRVSPSSRACLHGASIGWRCDNRKIGG
jgi:hypothetical protein